VIVLSDEPDVSALYAALNSSVQDAGRPAQAGYLIRCATCDESRPSRMLLRNAPLPMAGLPIEPCSVAALAVAALAMAHSMAH